MDPKLLPLEYGGNLTRAIAGTAATRTLLIALGLAADVIVARTLGPRSRGEYAAVMLGAMFLAQVLDFGLPTASTYLVARQPAWDGSLLTNHLVFAAIGLCVITPLTYYLASALATDFVAIHGSDVITAALGLVAVTVTLNHLNGILLGRQAIGRANLAALSASCTFLICILLLSSTSTITLSSIVLSHLLSRGIACAYALATLHIGGRMRPDASILSESLHYGSRVYVASLATLTNYRLDQLLVVSMLGPVQLGFYVIARGLGERLYLLPEAIATVMLPVVAAGSRADATARTSAILRLTSLCACCAVAVTAVTGPLLVPLVYGDAYSPVVFPLSALLPGVVALSASKVLAADLAGRGKPDYAMWGSILCVVLGLGLDLAFIPSLGITGAALAASISNTVSAAMFVAFFRRRTGASLRSLFLFTRADARSAVCTMQAVLRADRSRGSARTRGLDGP